MFSIRQKREIADAVQKILRASNHPELPKDEIHFLLHIDGAESWSWANIENNGAVNSPGVNLWNEAQDKSEDMTVLDTITVLKAIDDEPELPGFMPNEIWDSIKDDRNAAEQVMRIIIQETKKGIKKRLGF